MVIEYQAGEIFEFGPFRLEVGARRLLRNGQPVPLKAKLFDLLSILVQNHRKIVTKAELMKKLWPDVFVEESNLTVSISLLRRILDDRNGPRQYIETVSRRGYRFIARVKDLQSENSGVVVESFTETSPRATSSGNLKAYVNSLAVLPFVNETDNQKLEYLLEGVTESIVVRLSQLHGLRVLRHNTALRSKSENLYTQVVGRELNAQAVLVGRVFDLDNRLMINIELVNVADGTQLWTKQFSSQLSNIVGAQEEIAREVAQKLKLGSASEQQALSNRYAENIEVYQLYLKGRALWNERTEEALYRAIEYFEQAIELDPSYALAHVGIADCYIMLNAYSILLPKDSVPQMVAAVRSALELDDSLAEAHASLGYIKTFHYWDWQGAEDEFKLAIKLNPNYANAHHWYSLHLKDLGRYDEAIRELIYAQRLDPLSPTINIEIGLCLYMMRQYDQAIVQGEKILNLHPDFFVSPYVLGLAYAQTGRYDDAIEATQKCLDQLYHPEALGHLGYIYGRAGKRSEARKVLDKLKFIAKKRYVKPYFIALIYMGLNDKERALDWLKKAYLDRDENLALLGSDPRGDCLRSHPSFSNLLQKISLIG
jgi:DNA-binding winged helix-turn-helix (wHTH) protein/tetratricopeptide (TPR) repeat protein